MKLPSLTIVFACYDDEATIGSLVETSDRVARSLTDDYELVVVDDGSADGSPVVLERLRARLPRLRLIRHASHQGYGAVLQTGLARASKEWVFCTDGDGQYDVSELERCVALVSAGVDGVSGYKIRRRDPFYRVVLGGLYQRFAHRVFGVPLRDIDCGFRLLRRAALDGIRLESRTGVACLELAVKLQRAGRRLVECSVTHYPRRHGRSRFFTADHLLRAAGDLLRFWIAERRNDRRVISSVDGHIRRWPLLFLLAALGVSGPACGREEPVPPALQDADLYRKPYRFSTDWFTARVPVWRKALLPLAGKPHLHYLEIGVFEGRSALWMLENVLTDPTSRMTGVDTFPGDLEQRFRSNLALSGAEEKVTLLKGRSQTVLKSLPPEAFDLIYIDGSHVAKDVLVDAVLSWQLLKPGGLLIFDDYLWQKRKQPPELRPEVAIDSFLLVYRGDYELVHRGAQVILKKVR